MLAITRSSIVLLILALGFTCLDTSTASAQPSAIDNELSKINGHWRVIEMIENGRAIPENEMREWLPGGGVLEIVDYTIIFKSPIDGTKSTKSFRLDPTSYPKQIAIMDRDTTTGTGIYKFDQGKIVLCITNEAGQVPTEFNAPNGSQRTLIVMTGFDPGISDIPGLNAKLPTRKPLAVPTQPQPQPKPEPQVPAQVASSRIPPEPAVVAVPQQQAISQPPVVVTDKVAGRVLTDSEVRAMVLGTWRINDTEGSIDIVFDASGTFQSYRYYQTTQNFHQVFVPTPISSGTWTITGGRLIAKVSSSTRFDRLNQSFVPAVRSISANDMILVDHLGRVSRAVRTR